MSGFDERGPVGWQPPTDHPVIRALEAAGIRGEQLLIAIQELKDAGVLVSKGYYVPTSRELMDDYHALGYANLTNLIKVRWVMCAETRDVLAARYGRTQHSTGPAFTPSWWSDAPPSAEVLATEIRTVMERSLYWPEGQRDRLFGMPIRLDPVARRPVFEIIPEEERTDG
jgi:hypothetical protein